MIIIKLSNGIPSYAKPCEMCYKLLNKYKINKLYSIENNKIVKI